METLDQALLAEVVRRLDALAEGVPVEAVATNESAAPPVRAVVSSLNNLAAKLAALRQFSLALSNGQIEVEAPSHTRILGPLKALQAGLRHLTWQAQEVAAGNLTHKVDFLGEFSAAFNSMVDSLREKRSAEQQMLQASKLASIGLIANGVAHEINTPLQYIESNLQFLKDEVPNLVQVVKAAQGLATQCRNQPGLESAGAQFDDALRTVDVDYLAENVPSALQDSLSGAGQISLIVSSLKEFSDVGSGDLLPTDINHLVENVLTVSHHTWFEVAEVSKELAPGLPPVSCCAVEMGHVLFNLILNATQAIITSDKPRPGRITITTGIADSWVFIQVSDSGQGIPEAIRPKIFEPFFTTSPIKGKGLGLTMCRDIVEKKHKGTITVAGKEGEGAVLTVKLPATPTAGPAGLSS